MEDISTRSLFYFLLLPFLEFFRYSVEEQVTRARIRSWRGREAVILNASGGQTNDVRGVENDLLASVCKLFFSIGERCSGQL